MAQQMEGLFQPELAPRSFGQSLMAGLAPWRKHPLGIAGAVIVALLVLVAFAAPLIAPYDPRDFVGDSLESPNWSHPLGTNNLGQDVLSRTIHGAQVSLAVGFSATFTLITLGTLIGIVSAYAGGWVDMALQRIMEVAASIPVLILALIVVAVLGQPDSTSQSHLLGMAWQLRALEFAIAFAFLDGTNRLIRSAVLSERARLYVEAARSIGCSPARTLFRHVLPNVMPLVIIDFSTVIGVVILIEATLSFLGYGVSVGTPSWGIDLTNRNREFFLEAPWLLAGPGVALSLAVMGFNFLGDAIRDILDPRLRGSR